MPDVPAYFGRLLARGGMKEELKKYGDWMIRDVKNNNIVINRTKTLFDIIPSDFFLIRNVLHYQSIAFLRRSKICS